MKCDCCNQGLLEIKCCYKHRDQKIEDIIDNTFYLDHDLKLKKSHHYYTQIQFQMNEMFSTTFQIYQAESYQTIVSGKNSTRKPSSVSNCQLFPHKEM